MARACLICAVPVTVSHLGVDACRACAAFFKRSILARKRYVCRQGGSECTFRKHEKYMCRSCRLDKCLRMGMEYEQPRKRKARRSKVEEGESLGLRPSTSASSPVHESILDKMRSAYAASIERRLVEERAAVSARNLKRLDFAHLQEVYAGTLSSFYDFAHLSIRECAGFLSNVFVEFNDCPVHLKATLFKNFFGNFFLLEYIYHTTKHFKDGSHFMSSLLTCADVRNIEGWIDGGDVERKADFLATVNGFLVDYVHLLAPIIRMDDLEEREFHALIVLSCCDVDNSLDLSDDVVQTAADMRKRVFDELQYFYRNQLNLSDFSKRLGNLMTVLHAVREAGVLMAEEMRMYTTIFDIRRDDQLMREAFFE